MAALDYRIYVPESRQPPTLLVAEFRSVYSELAAEHIFRSKGVCQLKHRSIEIDRQTVCLTLIKFLTGGKTQFQFKRSLIIMSETVSISVNKRNPRV